MKRKLRRLGITVDDVEVADEEINLIKNDIGLEDFVEDGELNLGSLMISTQASECMHSLIKHHNKIKRVKGMVHWLDKVHFRMCYLSNMYFRLIPSGYIPINLTEKMNEEQENIFAIECKEVYKRKDDENGIRRLFEVAHNENDPWCDECEFVAKKKNSLQAYYCRYF